MSRAKRMNLAAGLIGCLSGGAIGVMAFFMLAQQGLYALALPGALAGLGAGWVSGIQSKLLGVIAGCFALVLGILLEWKFAPFVADGSLQYFVTHLSSLRPATIGMIVMGAVFGVWFGRGRGKPRRISQ